MPDKINNPHDKFVRETFSNIDRVTAFLSNSYPKMFENNWTLPV